jgi:hypothetical protein
MVLRSTLMMGLLTGFLFFQMPATFDRAFDRTGVALLVTLLSAVGVFNVVPLLMDDREVMYRHTKNNRCAPSSRIHTLFLPTSLPSRSTPLSTADSLLPSWDPQLTIFNHPHMVDIVHTLTFAL